MLTNLYYGELASLSKMLFSLVRCSATATFITKENLKFIFSYMPRTCSRCGNDMGYSEDLEANIADFFEAKQFMNEKEFEERIISKPCLPERLLQSLLNCMPHVFDKVLIHDQRLHCGGKQTDEAKLEVDINGRNTFLELVGESLCFFDSQDDRVPFKVIISRGLFLDSNSQGTFTLKFRNCVYKITVNEAEYCSALIYTLIKANSFRNFIDDYLELHEISSGGFGKVVLARHRESGRFVAVKIVEKNLSLSQEIMIQNEVTVLSMTKHPNLVKLLDLYEDLKNLYLVMEYLPYGSALEWLQKPKSNITRGKVVVMLKQIASATEYLHSRGIIHRDIKLSNVLICNIEANKFKLIDFGLACFTGPGEVAKGCVGSYRHVAPEMYLGRCYREEVDSWSFGVLAYYSLTMTFPFLGQDIEHKIISCEPDWTNKNLDETSIGLLKQLLTKQPKKRLLIGEMLDTCMLDELECSASIPQFQVKLSPFFSN